MACSVLLKLCYYCHCVLLLQLSLKYLCPLNNYPQPIQPLEEEPDLYLCLNYLIKGSLQEREQKILKREDLYSDDYALDFLSWKMKQFLLENEAVSVVF